ncbi:UNVERIFIED_CONTAM: hypothetical protein BEN50_02815 [Euhalothece sp. KZN 001]
MQQTSQLHWFYTLPDLARQNTGKTKSYWRVSSPAKANITRLCAELTEAGEPQIAHTLYQHLIQAEQGNVVFENWTAFLSRYSEKAAQKIKQRLVAYNLKPNESEDAIFEELFLISLSFSSDPIFFLKNFECEDNSNEVWYCILRGYCRKRAEGRLIDRLRTKEGTRTLMRSNLGLAAKASEQQVIESLYLSGIRVPKLDQYLLIWRCFIEVKEAEGINTNSPKPEVFESIAERANKLRNTVGEQAVNGNEVRAYLDKIGKAIRYYIDPPNVSLDAPISSEVEASLLDTIADEETLDDSSLTAIDNHSALNQLTEFIFQYLEGISKQDWAILFLLEVVELKQTPVSKIVGCTQKTISKKSSQSWEKLLEAVTKMEWMPTQSPVDFSTEMLTHLQKYLKDVVRSCLQSSFQNYCQSLLLETNQENSMNSAKQDQSELVKQYLLQLLKEQLDKKDDLLISSEIDQKLNQFIQTDEIKKLFAPNAE